MLFELIAERYERRSILITANQPFSGRDNVFRDPGMTVAVIDRLVPHSAISRAKCLAIVIADPAPTRSRARPQSKWPWPTCCAGRQR